MRNAVLYNGDFLGMNASTICANKYAKDGFKPSNRVTPQMEGLSLMDMPTKGYPEKDGFSWVELVCDSFVGRFGMMDIFMPKWLVNNYLDFIKIGMPSGISPSGKDLCSPP